MTMEKLLRCRDLGLDCGFEACGDTAEEALRIAADHAQAVHGVKSIPVRGPKRAWDAIQDAFCVPKGGFPPDEGIF
jgi:predicted small metal-binding protein